ncbi:MAG: hypothetical protein QE269_00530 [Fimbriimonas sp.]|jgi:hypothetical protein|nr:hypothetical protein [Fimbriimonas sp.]
MSPQLASKFDALDQRMEAMISRIQSLSPELLTSPVGQSMAPQSALEHMMITEGIYAKMINKAVGAKMAGKRPKVTFFYNFIIKAMQKPAGQTAFMPKMFAPTGIVNLESAAKEWRERRASIRAYLQHLDDDECCGGNLLEGRLSPVHVYELMSCHQDYHDARLP